MSGNLQIWEAVRNVPIEAKKTFNNGRFSGTDINPVWRIKKLTEQFGVCGYGWYYEITDRRLEKGEDGNICCFVDINLFVKINDEWSKAIQGTGGNMFVSKTKNGFMTSDECFKMALTDAISVACKALGIGADVYFDKDAQFETKYQEQQPQQSNNYVDFSKLQGAIDAANASINIAELAECWKAFTQFHHVPAFKTAIVKKKEALQNG